MNSVSPTALYHHLFTAYGPQRWWPARSAFEMMAGAILVQNTAWIQAAKVVARLKQSGHLSPAALRTIDEAIFWELIRPAGYFRVKGERLRALAHFLARYDDAPEQLFQLATPELRTLLLGVHGIGPETADSILCYGAARPIFVVDAYTRRLFSRLGWISPKASYDEMQELVHQGMAGAEAHQLGEFHALIVRHAKMRCAASKPKCAGCPVERCAGM